MSKGWIAVDLDGTLAQYRGSSYNRLVIGPPIEPMLARVLQWLEDDVEVRIFTARVNPLDNSPEDIAKITDLIEAWCLLHIGVVLPITCMKDFRCVAIWDDRAVRVIHGIGDPCCDYEA